MDGLLLVCPGPLVLGPEAQDEDDTDGRHVAGDHQQEVCVVLGRRGGVFAGGANLLGHRLLVQGLLQHLAEHE